MAGDRDYWMTLAVERQAEIERLRAVLEETRSQIIGALPKRGSRGQISLIVARMVVGRINAALASHDQQSQAKDTAK